MSRNLAIWLSEYAMKINTFQLEALTKKDFKELRDFVSLEFPVIQHLSNQQKLREIGKLACNGSEIHDEIKVLLSSQHTQHSDEVAK